jgi:transcription elongation factor Elf1
VTCNHEESVTTDMSSHGVMAEVTVCAACGQSLDYRPLREVDVAGSEDEMPVYESEIQAQARAAKAAEALAEAEAVILATPTGRSPDDLHRACAGTEPPPEATVEDVDLLVDIGPPPERSLERNREHAHEVVPCEKHGGEIEPCDTGERQAHNCQHGKWGSLRTFNSPCPCAGCHAP